MASPAERTTVRLKLRPNESPAAAEARVLAEGVVQNAVTTAVLGEWMMPNLDWTECIMALNASVASVRANVGGAEALLTAQAVALNAMFGKLARRADVNFGELLDAGERYMRLAVKAQGQCRATLETLAAVNNPPATVFARQANVAQGCSGRPARVAA